jgi:MFS family permease
VNEDPVEVELTSSRTDDRTGHRMGSGADHEPTGRATGAAPPAEPDPRRWKALWVCLVAGFMTLLDVSIVNVALPSIQTGVDATPSDLQWVVSGYALAFGLTLVPAGRLGDVLGRRTVFVVGVVLFGLASLACGIAPNSTLLIVARLVQGAAGGILNPQVSGLIQQLFRGAERGRAFGLLGATIGISTAVGPVVGGVILDGLGEQRGWRWIFFVNLPIAVAAAWCCSAPACSASCVPSWRRGAADRVSLGGSPSSAGSCSGRSSGGKAPTHGVAGAHSST